MINIGLEACIARLGSGVMRWSLVLFFIGFGIYKFTPDETAGVAPLMAHSPVLFWVGPLLGQRGGSDLIGAIEIALGTMIALRHVQAARVGLWKPGDFGRAAYLPELPVYNARP